jgi:hypothetical protein
MIASSSKHHFLAQPHQDLAAITPKILRLLDQLIPEVKLIIANDKPVFIDQHFSSLVQQG